MQKMLDSNGRLSAKVGDKFFYHGPSGIKVMNCDTKKTIATISVLPTDNDTHPLVGRTPEAIMLAAGMYEQRGIIPLEI